MNDMFLMMFDCFSNMPAGLTACDILPTTSLPSLTGLAACLSRAFMAFEENPIFVVGHLQIEIGLATQTSSQYWPRRMFLPIAARRQAC